MKGTGNWVIYTMHVNLLQHCVQAIDVSINLAITLQWNFTDTSTPKRASNPPITLEEGWVRVKRSLMMGSMLEPSSAKIWRVANGSLTLKMAPRTNAVGDDHTLINQWLAAPEHAVHSLNCQWTIYVATSKPTSVQWSSKLCFAMLTHGTASTEMQNDHHLQQIKGINNNKNSTYILSFLQQMSVQVYSSSLISVHYSGKRVRPHNNWSK